MTELAQAVNPAEMVGTWAIARVQGNFERKTAERLQSAGVNCYLPTVTRKKIYPGGERRDVECLVWERFLFVCWRDECELYRVHDERYFRGEIEVAKCGQAILAKELQQVHDAIAAGEIGEPDRGLVHGVPCRVKSGKWIGQTGYFEGVDRKGVFYIRVTMMGDSIPIPVDPDELELT